MSETQPTLASFALPQYLVELVDDSDDDHPNGPTETKQRQQWTKPDIAECLALISQHSFGKLSFLPFSSLTFERGAL